MLQVHCFAPIPLTVLGRRLASTHDASLTTTSQIDLGSAANSSPNVIMSTTSHSMVNPSLSAYRNTIPSGGSNNRQRTATESSSNGLLFTTERVKSNVSLSVRPLRPSLTAAATPLPSAYISSQQTQRHTHHHQIKSRLQNDRLALNRGTFVRLCQGSASASCFSITSTHFSLTFTSCRVREPWKIDFLFVLRYVRIFRSVHQLSSRDFD